MKMISKSAILENVKKNYILWIILLVATLLRFYKLDFQSVWLDEVHTMIESCPELTIAEFKEVIVFREGMGYLYFFICRIFQEIFGISSHSVRMFSAIMGVASVYMIYNLGKSLMNKNTGLVAAILMTVNAWLIFYSQEARPYMLLVFAVILSFKLLVDFIRKPNYKTAIFYGISTGLIVNTHFISLSTLFSQYVLLFFIFCVSNNKQKFNLFKLGFISFIVTLFLSWNTYPIFIKVLDYKSGWLTLPGRDGFTQIFYDLLGGTEMLTFIFSTCMIFFIINLFQENISNSKLESYLENKLIFASILLFSWLFLPIFIPIIKSYTSEPMIFNRYFIALIPALTLAISIGIGLIKNNTIKHMVVIVIISFALTDVFLVKEYYSRINKTQFREISEKIIEKNTSNSKIVSSWGWHFQYFFNRHPSKMKVVDKPMSFQNYVNELIAAPIEKKPFWYIAAHFQPYTLTPESEKYLDDNFNVVEKLDYFDCWARYYVPKTDAKELIVLNINKFEPIKSDNSVNILLFSNSTTKSEFVTLDSGQYRLAIKAKSLPEVPIQGQNANIAVSISGKEIGAYFLDEKEEKIKYFIFTVDSKKDIQVGLTFGNDIVEGKSDRNALIFSVNIEKVIK